MSKYHELQFEASFDLDENKSNIELLGERKTEKNWCLFIIPFK